jgi:Fic family protein
MQLISGAGGKERVNLEALAAGDVGGEIHAFLEWFNGDAKTDWVMKAGLAHFWFITIHPFDDGNGRIARAIADMALGRSERSSPHFYSMSAQIRTERAAYREILSRRKRERRTSHLGWNGS